MTSNQIEKYKPYLILAKDEKYRLGYIDDYIKMSRFTTTDKSFEEVAMSPGNGKGMTMVIKDEFKDTYKTMEADDPSVYTYVNTDGNKKQILYFFFYNYNGPKDVLGLISIGAHTADIEWICIELHDDFPVYVFLSQHGNNKRFDYNTFRKEGTHVVAYSAINSHAHYPAAGTYFRILGFGNDICSEGTKVKPFVQRIQKNSPLILYKGKFGDTVDGFDRFNGTWLH